MQTYTEQYGFSVFFLFASSAVLGNTTRLKKAVDLLKKRMFSKSSGKKLTDNVENSPLYLWVSNWSHYITQVQFLISCLYSFWRTSIATHPLKFVPGHTACPSVCSFSEVGWNATIAWLCCWNTGAWVTFAIMPHEFGVCIWMFKSGWNTSLGV